MDNGSLQILNVHAGDVTVTFDSEDDLKKADTMIPDLIRKGFAVMVKMEDGKHQRVKGYDPKTQSYEVAMTTPPDTPPPKRGRSRPKKVQRLPVRSTKALAIGRTAGG
jgi:hypothetical protein